LKVCRRCGCRRLARQMRCTVCSARPTVLAIARLVQRVIPPGGSPQVNASTLLTVSIATGFLPGARARPAAHLLAVGHQRHIVQGAEQQAPHKAAKPPIDRLPRPEISRQHPPAAARARQVADAFRISRRSTRRLRPRLAGFGRSDLICSHSSSVRSVG